MTATYETIATTTLGSNTATVTFSSIPATYTDLALVMFVRSTYAGTQWDVTLRFNSDSGSNYSSTWVSGSGSAASSGRNSNQSYGYFFYLPAANATAGVYGVGIANIMNYANTTTNKTVLTRNNDPLAGVGAYAGLWRSTAAISSITIEAPLVNLASGSTFSLYGIKSE
jgi:hypothetical protein